MNLRNGELMKGVKRVRRTCFRDFIADISGNATVIGLTPAAPIDNFNNTSEDDSLKLFPQFSDTL